MNSCRFMLVLAMVAVVLTACGPASTATVTATIAPTADKPTKEPTATKRPTSTPKPTSTPRPTATPKPTKTPTPEPTLAPTSAPFTGATITYVDPAGDCLDNSGDPIACDPQSLDILMVTVSRPGSGDPITITVELAGSGLDADERYAVMYTFDLDRNNQTGDTNFPPDHGTAPEMEILIDHGIGRAGQINYLVFQFDAAGKKTDGDTTLVNWIQQDDTHLVLVLYPRLITGNQFNFTADVITTRQFDHIVDHGSLQFPEGTTALIK